MKSIGLALLCAVTFVSTLSADDPLSLKDLIAKVRPSVVTIRVEGRDGDNLGIGTGFVIDSAGLIATNFHVINEGRRFSIETSDGKQLKVESVEASDRNNDLALIRVAIDDKDTLIALPLSDQNDPAQGTQVSAFGNPLGLKDSVVDGIVSAVREVQGRPMIQLAMPIEPGNSGGPLVDRQGRVLGIINMKSAIDDNLGFAIPVDQLQKLRKTPNPVAIDRWVRLGTINPERWKPIMGATWQQRGGMLTARGMGKGFGGRSLCLSQDKPPALPFEIAVNVKLDDEAGAAGIAFYSDGENKHYGFYPSNGQLRLTCFKGPDVYSWQILQDVPSEHYLPGQWNRLRVRLEKGSLKCFVNDHLVITSSDQQLSNGSVGVVKFRDTNPDFRGFTVGTDLKPTPLSDATRDWLAKLDQRQIDPSEISEQELNELGMSGETASRELIRRAAQLSKEAKQLRGLADEIKRTEVLSKLAKLFAEDKPDASRLLDATLLVAQLDQPEMDLDHYRQRIETMAVEIRNELKDDSDTDARIAALNNYLFRENGFHGGRSEYYHPANSHLNRVIDDREGLPISLSILYMELSRRLDLNITGVGLPGHFVVRSEPTDDVADHQLIDVYEGGSPISLNEAGSRVMQYTRRRITDNDLRAQSDREIITRVLSNLMGIATREEDIESMLRYIEANVAINPDAVDFRMMRAQLRAMTGRKSRAIADIDHLLKIDPPGIDSQRLRQLRTAIETQ
ncbi:MAG: tetratricopeptide repeat protein [Pirellulaceae bacterium]